MKDISYELLDIDWSIDLYEGQESPAMLIEDDSTLCTPIDTEIPRGNNKEDIKVREKIIKAFYSSWIASNPTKAIYNNDLKALIHVKFVSINETVSKAARSYESTCAVLRLTEILQTAVYEKDTPPKWNQNQKAYEKMLLMRALSNVKLVVGLQRTTQEYVQYSVTVPTPQNK